MSQLNKVRIIGGQWRGRKLEFPSVEGLRPTHDRIRETVFNWLMNDIVGATCLDLFAGSGAFGFEAASRGAREVILVDKDRDVCLSLQQNCRSLQTSQVSVIQGDFKSAPFQVYDIVFLDPPFHHNLCVESANWLEITNRLSDGALIYLEIEKGHSISDLPSNWVCSRHKSTSSLDYYLFYRKSV